MRAGVIAPITTNALELSTVYDVKRPEEVAEWLRRFPDLQSVLMDAHRQMPRFFNPGYRLELEILRSPEGPEADELVATIRVPGTWKDASERYERFKESWWGQRAAIHWGRLSFLLEFFD